MYYRKAETRVRVIRHKYGRRGLDEGTPKGKDRTNSSGIGRRQCSGTRHPVGGMWYGLPRSYPELARQPSIRLVFGYTDRHLFSNIYWY